MNMKGETFDEKCNLFINLRRNLNNRKARIELMHYITFQEESRENDKF